MKKYLLSIIISSLTAWNVQAQNDFEPINTGVANFLTIPTDAHSAGMGGTGTALTNNLNAVFHNGASTILNDIPKAGATYTFAPWMREYESGYSLNTLGGFYKINKKNVILGGFRHYKYPKVGMVEEAGASKQNVYPKEWAIDLGYAREILPNLAASATIKYIHSDMGNFGEAKSANAVAVDLGVIYKRSLPCIEGANWTTGLQVNNLGTKMKYLETKEYLPALAKLGGAVDMPFTPIHRLIVTADLGYRFAPTDIKALNVSAGAEYTYQQHFSLRGGYHYGDKKKGDMSFATAGLGIHYWGGNLDFAWLFAKNDCPQRNTFWVSLGYAF